ncbi:hypothetical protein RRG08_012187 [Elysia crispata]|uniref:Uncharacterized protein n=1 Tax=Elysia crispata TaxID=231223 RepID=A0AAE1DH71_9GAST|nr:hypothetical protein RRG08_012187 [Elysia crispata]
MNCQYCLMQAIWEGNEVKIATAAEPAVYKDICAGLAAGKGSSAGLAVGDEWSTGKGLSRYLETKDMKKRFINNPHKLEEPYSN